MCGEGLPWAFFGPALSKAEQALRARWQSTVTTDEIPQWKLDVMSCYAEACVLLSLINSERGRLKTYWKIPNLESHWKAALRDANTLLDVAEDLIKAGSGFHELAALLLIDVSNIGNVGRKAHWVHVCMRLHSVRIPTNLVWARDWLFARCKGQSTVETAEFRIPWQVVIMERRIDRKAHQSWFTRQARPPRGLQRDEHPISKRTMRDVFYCGSSGSDAFGSTKTKVTPITEIFDLITEERMLGLANVRVVVKDGELLTRKKVSHYMATLLKDCYPVTVRTSESSLGRLRKVLRQVRAISDDVGAPTGRLLKIDHQVEILLDPVDFPEVYMNV
jgi:energy-converting hydrogenase A subunit M